MSLPPPLVGLLSVLPLAAFLGLRFARLRPRLDATGRRRFVRLVAVSLAAALSLVALLALLAGSLPLALPFQLLLAAVSARLLAPKRPRAGSGGREGDVENDDSAR